jgi:hypothetical protein
LAERCRIFESPDALPPGSPTLSPTRSQRTRPISPKAIPARNTATTPSPKAFRIPLGSIAEEEVLKKGMEEKSREFVEKGNEIYYRA